MSMHKKIWDNFNNRVEKLARETYNDYQQGNDDGIMDEVEIESFIRNFEHLLKDESKVRIANARRKKLKVGRYKTDSGEW
jgi:hypothetical protein